MRRFLLPALVCLIALVLRVAYPDATDETPVLVEPTADAGSPADDKLLRAEWNPGAATPSDRRVVANEQPAAGVGQGPKVPTISIGLDVRIQDSWKEDAPRHADMGFTVGIARSSDHVEGPVGEHKRVLALGKSGADGSAALELEVPAELIDDWGRDARLWGHVSHPGKRAYLKTTTLPDGDERAELKLFPRSGASLTGRVLRADGKPAHPAKVQLYPASEPGAEYVYNEDSCYTDVHGGFQLDADEPGVYDVQCSASGQGSAGVRGVLLEATGESGYIELQLSGDGVIAGILLDPDGKPVPRYRLWCAPEEHRDEWVGYLHDPQQIPHEWGGGLYGDHSSTDEAGRFEFKGLRAGSYHLRGHTAQTGYYQELLTDRAVPVGTLDLELRLARHRVLARILDHKGEYAQVDPMHRPGRDKLPRHALYLEECDAEGRLLKSERYSHETRERLASGDFVLDVAPGKSYVLGVFSRECALVEQRFDVTPGDYEQILTVRLPAPAPGTLLEVELQTPTGDPLETDNAQRLYAPHSGRLLWESSSYNDDPTAKLAIGPGRYRWNADAEPARGHHGERWGATPYAPVSDELEVLPGRINRFERRLAGSGRVSLLVTSTRSPKREVATEGPEWEALGWKEQLRITSGSASVRFEQSGRISRPSFGHGHGGNLDILLPIGGTLEAPFVPLGHRVETVDPLQPGTYRMIVELDGLGRRACTIEIRAGEVTELTVSFDE